MIPMKGKALILFLSHSLSLSSLPPFLLSFLLSHKSLEFFQFPYHLQIHRIQGFKAIIRDRLVQKKQVSGPRAHSWWHSQGQKPVSIMILPNFLVPGSSYSFSLPLTHCIKTTLNQSNLRYRRKAYGIFQGWCRKQGQDFLSGEDLQGMYYIENSLFQRKSIICNFICFRCKIFSTNKFKPPILTLSQHYINHISTFLVHFWCVLLKCKNTF